MADEAVYDEVQLDEMEWVEDDGMYYYQCPCGDMFELSKVRAARCDFLLAPHASFCPPFSPVIRRRTSWPAMASHDARVVR